ncbi:MAG: AtpZ/AtpI family protein [Thermohalobaculum sp.]|nr:AtpZ/AtpI family protein [Thermohalobaculum sp.]
MAAGRDTDTPAAKAVDAIARQAERRAAARQAGRRTAWFGLGMFGMVGWAIAVPTLIGIALGLWLDRALPQAFSWTVALLFAGVVLGGLNAWYWISREGRRE